MTESTITQDEVSVYKINSIKKSCNRSNFCTHVYITKSATHELSKCIEQEYWGNECVNLYKYLDYTWRIQLLTNMVKLFTFNNHEMIVFNSGLIKNNSIDYIYILAIHNNTSKKVPWLIDNGTYFVTKSELVNIYGFNEYDIPYKNNYITNKKDIIFNNKYSIKVNWKDKIKNASKRLLEYLNINKIEEKYLKKLLQKSLKETLKKCKINNNIIGKQVFIERKMIKNSKITTGYHIQHLLPLHFMLNGNLKTFVLVLESKHYKKFYKGTSIITTDMAYWNSRLMGRQQVEWLKYSGININQLNNNSNVHFNNNIDGVHLLNTRQSNPISYKYEKMIENDINLNTKMDESMFFLITAFPEYQQLYSCVSDKNCLIEKIFFNIYHYKNSNY